MFTNEALPSTYYKANRWQHAFFVFLFVVAPAIAFVQPPGERFFPPSQIFVQDTFANIAVLLFFYTNYYLLLPKLFFTRKYGWYSAASLVCLALVFVLPFIMGKWYAHSFPITKPPGPFAHAHMALNIGGFIFDEFRRHIPLFFTAIFLSFYLSTQKKLQLAKQEKTAAELSNLKAQINPHFLFNTLNTIYGLTLTNNKAAAPAILDLAGIMRYILQDASKNVTALQNEIDYIKNYIQLQQARVGSYTQISVSFPQLVPSNKISPLLLITFIENAFKYGCSPDHNNCFVQIKIHCTQEQLTMHVKNSTPTIQTEPGHGMGLANARKRLETIYGNSYTLQINQEPNSYTVYLQIPLHP